MVLVDIPGDVLVAIEKLKNYGWKEEQSDFEEHFGLDADKYRDHFIDRAEGFVVNPLDWDPSLDENDHAFLHMLRIDGFFDKNPIIEAEDGPEFQEYVFKNGKPVPAGTPIGIEVSGDNGVELKLFDNILFSDIPRE